MKKILSIVLCFALVVSLCAAVSAQSAVFVSPSGADSNDGSLASPFATLQKAVDAAGEGGVVYLREGTYEKGATLKSGITIKSYNNEKVVFSAAQKASMNPLTDEEKVILKNHNAKTKGVVLGNIKNPGKLVTNKVTPALLNNDEYEPVSVFFDGKRFGLIIDEEKTFNNQVLNYQSKESMDDGLAKYTFGVDSEKAPLDFDRIITYENIHVTGSIDDCEFFSPIEYDPKKKQLTMVAKDFVLEDFEKPLEGNIIFGYSAESIDKPGEWAISGDKVYYYPKTTSENIEYIADFTTFINGNGASNVKISDIEFSKTLANAVELKNCKNIQITNCDFSYISDVAIKIDNGEKVVISNCDFTNNAGKAVVLSGDNNIIDNCGFEKVSLLRMGAYPIIHINGNSNTISNCEISNCPREIIHIEGKSNTVVKNFITDVGAIDGNSVIKILEGAEDNKIISNRFYKMARNTPEFEVQYDYYRGRVIGISNEAELKDIEEDGFATNPLIAVYVCYGAGGTEVTNNVFDKVNVGVYIEGSENNKIKSNIFRATEYYVELSYYKDGEFPEKIPYKNNEVTDNIFCDQDDIFVSKEMKDNGNVIENNIKVSNIEIINRDGTLNEDGIKEKDPDFEILNFEEVGRYEVVQEESVFDTGIMLLIGSDNVSAKGVISKIDASARIVDGRTLVPVRYISEAFGEKVLWDDATKTVTVGENITITLGEPSITVNGKKQPLDVPAAIYDSRTFVPLRAIAEALGKYVFWDNRGLIVITDSEVSITEDEASELIEKLK